MKAIAILRGGGRHWLAAVESGGGEKRYVVPLCNPNHGAIMDTPTFYAPFPLMTDRSFVGSGPVHALLLTQIEGKQ